MGGFGSGQSGGRPTVESSLTLDVNRLDRDGILRPRTSTWNGTLTWRNVRTGEATSWIGYSSHLQESSGHLRLKYTVTRSWSGEKIRRKSPDGPADRVGQSRPVIGGASPEDRFVIALGRGARIRTDGVSATCHATTPVSFAALYIGSAADMRRSRARCGNFKLPHYRAMRPYSRRTNSALCSFTVPSARSASARSRQ
jgi:hypothetical protein